LEIHDRRIATVWLATILGALGPAMSLGLASSLVQWVRSDSLPCLPRHQIRVANPLLPTRPLPETPLPHEFADAQSDETDEVPKSLLLTLFGLVLQPSGPSLARGSELIFGRPACRATPRLFLLCHRWVC
jgi:hypothetical protein